MATNQWMNDERIKAIDKKKLDFIQKLVFELDSLDAKQKLPFLMALASRANKENISFENGEIDVIIAVIKENSTAEEVAKMEKMIKMFQKNVK